MARRGRGFRFSFLAIGQSSGTIAGVALLATLPATAQAPLRCDLQLESTPGIVAGPACLDLVALQAGGTPIVTASNATRISIDGFSLCKSAFTVSKPAGADIVFIYDNSGSMWSHYAKINAATGDTSFYHAQGCGGGGGLTGTPLTYNTVIGPRTVTLLDASANCTGFAGDPFFARAKVITQAIDFLATTSPNSTAGAVAFARDTNYVRPPLLLSGPGNPELVKASLKLDSIPNTNYLPPLRLAAAWLADSALTNTTKQAIVFLSDGEPNDGNQLTPWLNANSATPIYTIALGDTSAPFTRMEDMSQATGGRFYRVTPENIAGMNQVMQDIIKAITIVDMPTGIQVTNNSFSPPMVSRSASMVRNADSSISPVMDSIVALKQGANALTVKISMSDSEVRNFNVSVQADGPVAPASTQTLVCSPLPVLTLLNQTGGVDPDYPYTATQYDVKLTRATSDLKQVIVVATSGDTSRPGWGDQESITLPQTSLSGNTTLNLRENYPLDGVATNAIKGNNTLEAAAGGEIILVWTHPRDSRETATFRLPGRKIATAPGFIDVMRATDAPKGVSLPANITDPVVIRGGVTLVRNPGGAILTHKGDLSNPHRVGDDILDPDHTPTFVFNTASPFSYHVKVFDHLGQFLNSRKGSVDSARWEQMRGNADSLACAFSILPISKDGQRFATGVYILYATVTTRETHRKDPNRPLQVKPMTKAYTNRFGYVR